MQASKENNGVYSHLMSANADEQPTPAQASMHACITVRRATSGAKKTAPRPFFYCGLQNKKITKQNK